MMLAMAQKRTKRGKFETFDNDENDALRDALQEYVSANDLSTNDLKPILHVSQQTAAGYLNGSGGFSLPSAKQLVWLLGFDGVDDFMKAKGVFKTRDGTKLGKKDITPQDFAMTLARRVGVSDVAMARVIKRYANETHHIERWWLDRFIQEQTSVDEERLRRLEEARNEERH